MTAPSLLIFDGELTSVSSHCFEYDRMVATTAAKYGIATTVLAHHSLDEGVTLGPAGAAIMRGVSVSIWLDDYRRYLGQGLFHELLGKLRHGWSNARDIWRYLRPRRFDCLFVPSVFHADIIAWAFLHFMGAFRRVDRVVFLLRYDVLDHAVPNPVPARKMAIYRWIFRLLRGRIQRGQLVLLADSAQLRADHQLVMGVDSTVVSMPRTSLPRNRPHPGAGDPVTFGISGLARYEKGVDLLLAAIAEIVASGEAPNARFVVQLGQPILMPDGSVFSCPPEVAASDRVEIIDSALSLEDYEALLQRIDCMVLPYRNEFYHSRTSAIAIEASCMDMPMIYTADSWLEDYAAAFGAGLAVPSGDHAALRRAIVAMATGWESFAQQATGQGHKARARNDCDDFLRVLWGPALPPPLAAPALPGAGGAA